MGTQKEDDSYYYGSASVEIKSFGRLGGVGDDYSYILRNIDVEQYLSVFIKNKFGDRVLIDVDVQHKKTGDGSWWAGYKSKSLKEMRDDIKKDPEKNRIELKLYLYIFDRIDNEQEKEERRKQIYDFVQYLKEEGLFEYLKLGVSFIDERVLAPSYEEKYRMKLIISDTERKIIDGEIVYLPPMKLRKEISEVLQEELAKMSEEELMKSMNRIKKSQLSYETIGKNNEQYYVWVCSINMLEIDHRNMYEEYKKENALDLYYYEKLDDIMFSKNNSYIY